VLRLPDSLRDAFKEPFGPVYTETEALLSAIDETAAAASDASLIAVGDMVTYHLLKSGRQPDVAVTDGKTEREAVDEAIADALTDPDGLTRRVSNPPAELSEAILVALREAIESPESTTIIVDGEEDLATLPAILAAPPGSSVVYGQPGEGMVQVAVTEAQTAEARRLLGEFDGDTAAALQIVGG
jgi:hypothetical protein